MSEKPPIRRAGTVANLFETLDPSSPVDGVKLQLPDDWQLKKAYLLRYGTNPVPVQRHADSDGAIFLSTASPMQSPHELVLQVQVGDRPETHRWHLTPFVRIRSSDASDSLSQQSLRILDRRTQRVRVAPPAQSKGPNQALDLSRATGPGLVDLPPRLAPGGGQAFTIEFWLRTNGLNQVPLSSWTGEETAAYPFEFLVDRGGNLRFYCGRAGRHEALRTTVPVADGHWHHVAVTYDPTDEHLRLLLDGATADSLRPQALPSLSGSLPIAIGGRRPSPAQQNDAAQRRFTGQLDEVRIWPAARSEATLRTLRTRPYSAPEDDDAPFHLSFNADAETERPAWPEGTRRVPTTLTFQSPLRGLQAHTDGQSVTLRWTATTADEGPFIVERSPDGRSFTEVERLSPLDANPSSGEPKEFVYTDPVVSGNVVYYRVRQVSSDSGVERATGTIKIGLGGDTAPDDPVNLLGNFPNPFKESTTIAYRVKESQPVTLTVWNVSGKRVATLAEGMHEPGYYERTFTARNLPSAPLFVRLESTQGVQSDRMVVLK